METQKENKKPSSLGGVRADLNYSGRTRARWKKYGGEFRLQQNKKKISLFILALL